MIAILSVFQGDDGRWEAHVPDVRGSDDVATVPSLEGLKKERARVRVQGVDRELTVYRDHDDAFVIWDEALPA